MSSQEPKASLEVPRRSHGHEHPHGLSELVQSISQHDAEVIYKTKSADNRITPDDGTPDSGLSSDNGGATASHKTIVSWELDDPENPYNFSTKRKMVILIVAMFCIVNSTMSSALPSMAIPMIAQEFGVTTETQLVLPISTFLIGYVLGPLFWGPLSEHVGRRPVTCLAFLVFVIWSIACAVAPSWPALLVFRFLTGAFGSAAIPGVTGTIADIFGDPLTRGRAMSWFMATTVFGPLFAPVISGFCSTSIGWRWSFWVGIIYAGATAIPIFSVPETFGPVLLTKRAKRIRKENPGTEVYSAAELERRDMKELATVVLTRPLRMIFTEPIVSAVCAYLSLVYAIFYMSFQAFPIIFRDVYGLAPGVVGLCYLPIGGGTLLAIPIFMAYDSYLAKARERGEAWTKKEESRRLPLAFIGGPLFVVSLFWLGWSAKTDVSFAVPMLAGVPFGSGFMLIFIALLNYITDAYEIFAASANAAASSSRSVMAVILPLATTPMFARLGISGACSLLGGLSALMCVIPFVFMWKGEALRSRSKFCIALKQRKAEMERREEEERRRKQQEEGQAQPSSGVLFAGDEKQTV